MGDKGCHYKKTITLFNAAGDVVTSEKSVATPTTDSTVKSVEIDWVRLTE